MPWAGVNCRTHHTRWFDQVNPDERPLSTSVTLFVKRPALAGVIFAAAAACAMAAPQPLIIDARRSQIEVQVRATAHAFTARLMAFTAAMTVDPETVGVTAAQMRFHFSDLDTGNPARNRAMQMAGNGAVSRRGIRAHIAQRRRRALCRPWPVDVHGIVRELRDFRFQSRLTDNATRSTNRAARHAGAWPERDSQACPAAGGSECDGAVPPARVHGAADFASRLASSSCG